MAFSSSHSQDPKIHPTYYVQGSTRATPLYDIILLSLSQPLVHCRLPGPPVYIFFGEMANHLGWGAPKSTHPSWHIYTRWFIRVAWFPFFLMVHIEMGLRHPFDTYPHDRRYTCPGSFSGLMILKRMWWCTMALPSAMVHLLSLPPNWILGWTDNFWPAVPVTLVPPFFLLWADRPLSLWTDRLS